MPTIKEVSEIWKQCDSIKATAAHLQISESAVRKALITEGLYTNSTVSSILELRERGLTQQEIAEQLGISVTAVNANLPYERGTYLDQNKTQNALKIRECRDRKKPDEKASAHPAGFHKYVRLKTGERGILIRMIGETAVYSFPDGEREIRKEEVENEWD